MRVIERGRKRGREVRIEEKKGSEQGKERKREG
jgi:hypothetical protein